MSIYAERVRLNLMDYQTTLWQGLKMAKLTREQIDAMEAGREMDALIAELVMGWQHPRVKINTVTDEIEDYWYPIPEAQTHIQCPHFSTSVAAAWQVVEKFDAYNINWNYWRKVHRYELSKYGDEPGMEGIGWGLTPALAICRAALKAVTK